MGRKGDHDHERIQNPENFSAIEFYQYTLGQVDVHVTFSLAAESGPVCSQALDLG